MRAIAIVFFGWLMPQLWLDWSLQIEGDYLRIDYVVHNHSSQRVLLFDQLWRDGVQPEQVMVANRSVNELHAPEALRFIRGYDVDLPDHGPVFPTGRHLMPGGHLAGVARILLPVRSWWHSSGVVAPCCAAVLEIGYSDDLSKMLIDNGYGSLKLRDMRESKLLRGGVRQIPREAMDRAHVPNEYRAWRGGPWVKSTKPAPPARPAE